jgi:hypothetical protein
VDDSAEVYLGEKELPETFTALMNNLGEYRN